MPRLIEGPPPAAPIDLDALVDHCESAAFDPRDRESLAAAAPMLRAGGQSSFPRRSGRG